MHIAKTTPPVGFATGLLGAAVVATWACSSSPSGPSPVLNGIWGGDHIALTIADTGSHLEFDCAHGDIPGTLTLDAGNQFNTQGTFVREHGGPIRVGEVPDSHPAAYMGSVAGTTMMLTVRLTETNEVIGTFTLLRGASGRVVKCLLPLAAADHIQYRAMTTLPGMHRR